MHVLRRLLRVGTIADSMGVYVPAMILQKSLGLGRVLLFAYLMVQAQMGLWALGMMIFTIVAPVMTLGSSNGLVRYVSFYEARGKLEALYRQAGKSILVCGVIMLILGLLAAPLIAKLLVAYRPEQAGAAAGGELLSICLAAVANAFLLSLHANQISFMVGMRAYRLAAAVELFFTVVFTVFSLAALLVMPSGLTVLLAHLAALAVTLLLGMKMLHAGVTRLLPAQEASDYAARSDKTLIMEPHTEAQEITQTVEYPILTHEADADNGVNRVFPRIIRFGLIAMAGNFLWLAAQYVSFFITYLRCGKDSAGVFAVFLQLSQPALFLANAAWAVIFTHVARHWETGRRQTGMMVLETSYKAIAMVMMTLTVAVYVSAPLWVLILPESYRHGLGLLGGLLTFFQVVIHLAIMTIIAKLHERPSVIAIAAVAGGAANIALAAHWMGRGESAPEAAAWAAGIGMFAGAGVVTLVYFLLARIRLHAGTCFVLASPALLLAAKWVPVWTIAAIWAGICAIALLTTAFFSVREKQLLSASLKRIGSLAKRVIGK